MKKFQTLFWLVGVLAFVSFGAVNLSAKCGGAEMAKEMPKGMKCGTGKCGAAMKKRMQEKAKDANATAKEVKKEVKKVVPKAGKCGVGKCG